jgi:hypothetical protein
VDPESTENNAKGRPMLILLKCQIRADFALFLEPDPENNSSENNRHHSLSLTVFPLRPFLVPDHHRLSLTEAFPPQSVNTLAHQDGHSRIENASI